MLRTMGKTLLGVCLSSAVPGVGAAPVEYVLDLPADRMLAYRLEFEVAHPGRFAIDAEWSPARVLVLRLERPGRRPLRRSGPPPQHLELEVGADEIEPDAPWTLVINGLPHRQPAAGMLVIELPEPVPPVRERPDPPAEAPAPAPWMLPAAQVAGLSPEQRRLVDATERFRQLVVRATEPDDYRWQQGMLRFLADRRDRATARPGEPIPRTTRTALERVVDTVRKLDRLRASESRPLDEPVPDDPVRRRAWRAVRDPRYPPVEAELDALLNELHRGHLPELAGMGWFSSFLSCLIVCERHFEERARLGSDRASNGDLVTAQWDRVLAAVEALAALAELHEDADEADYSAASPAAEPSSTSGPTRRSSLR